jgi:hypothetical protein
MMDLVVHGLDVFGWPIKTGKSVDIVADTQVALMPLSSCVDYALMHLTVLDFRTRIHSCKDE